MHRNWRALLLAALLVHFNGFPAVIPAEDVDPVTFAITPATTRAPTTTQSDASESSAEYSTEDTPRNATLLAGTPVTPVTAELSESQDEPKRKARQLLYSPNFIVLPRISAEGGKCLTTAGSAGYCVRFGTCRSTKYYRLARQFAFFTLREWPLQTPAIGDEICHFYDRFGRPNTGVCCTESLEVADNSLAGFNPISFIPQGVYGAINPAVPIPAPPAASPPPKTEEDVDDTEVIEGTADDMEIEDEKRTDMSSERRDDQNVVYDPVNDEQTPTRMSYDDYRYQWASQFPANFAGIQHWPPPLPTHPPSTGVWPPPLPTHPPNHHYPTHPSTSAGVTTTRRTSTSTTSTTSTTTRQPTTTTTRRYPGFPNYPSYPVHTTTTTTTTRRPPSPVVGDTSSSNLPQQCGIKNPVSPDQERIVGGINASPHEFPWIAVLFKSGKQFCGGSLITKNHILTAAHCVARMTSWDVAALTANLGDYNIRTDFEVQHVQRRIKRLVRHKGFEFSTLHNDIAILTVNEPLKFTHEIQPICLPTTSVQQGRSYSGHTATVAGWGSLRENGPQPSILQKVQIPIWPNSECARKYGRAAPGGIIASMICAGQASKDSCSGDSGGPLIVQESGRYTQVGIVSWGIGCGKGEYPGVYTRITALLPWIYKNIK